MGEKVDKARDNLIKALDEEIEEVEASGKGKTLVTEEDIKDERGNVVSEKPRGSCRACKTRNCYHKGK